MGIKTKKKKNPKKDKSNPDSNKEKWNKCRNSTGEIKYENNCTRKIIISHI